MDKIFNVSLQTKILAFIIMLILLVIIILATIFIYLESEETREQTKQLALQTAKTVSFMPTVGEAFRSDDPSYMIQPMAEQVRAQVKATSVIVANKDGVIYSHPDPGMIGKKMLGDDNYRAIVFGGYYNSEVTEGSGDVIRGKAPIFVDYGDYKQVVGVVSVGFSKAEIQSTITNEIFQISLYALFVLFLGVTGGVFLARNIKKDTLGLEPYEIASLYRERNAILLSIREGVIAIDESGRITMINSTAQKLLGITGNALRQPIEKLLPDTRMLRVLKTGVAEKDREMVVGNKTIIVNRTPVRENGRIVGVVASFRDKTEIQDMINTLSEVRKYSEDLRAQTHEFTNKLYVLSGLLQLGKFSEAIDMIQKESTVLKSQNRIVFDQIRDPKVQAILLGKISKASEKKINFTVDENSSIEPLPEHIKVSQLATMIGNVIDNAFEAVEMLKETKEPTVSFFAIDIGHDIVFEVSDNGVGIADEQIDLIFEKGFSMKGKEKRGYGLANVKEAVRELGGIIEIKNRDKGGTIFTITIPKKSAAAFSTHWMC